MKFSSVLVLAAIAGTSTAWNSTCCNAPESTGCTDPAFPEQQQSGTLTINGIGMVTCCASADNYVNNVGGNPTCKTSPSAGFASSTSVAIGASVALLAMIFV